MEKGIIVKELPTLQTYAENLQSQLTVCELLLQSRMMPAHLNSKAAIYMIVITGQEYGFSPMRSIHLFDLIKGRVSPRACALQAIAQANHGRFFVVESTDEKITIRAERVDISWKETLTFSMQDAKRAGLTGDNWTKYPRDMMYARCISRLARHGWADIIGGLNSYEEMEDAIQSEKAVAVEVNNNIDSELERMKKAAADYNNNNKASADKLGITFLYDISKIEDELKKAETTTYLAAKGAFLQPDGLWLSQDRLKRMDKYQVINMPSIRESSLLAKDAGKLEAQSAINESEWDAEKFVNTPTEEMI